MNTSSKWSYARLIVVAALAGACGVESGQSLEVAARAGASGGDEMHAPALARTGDEPGRIAAEVLAVAPAASGRMVGTAHDLATGAALPCFTFQVGVDDGLNAKGWRNVRWIEVVTDADGRFETEEELPAGPVRLNPFPGSLNEGQPARFSNRAEFVPGELGWGLGFEVGPTFALELSGAVPARDATLQAWIVCDGTLQQLAHAPVHRGDLAWVRFPAPLRYWSAPPRLAIGDAHGFVFGSAPIADTVGGELTIELAATGALDVRIEGEVPVVQEPCGSSTLEWPHWQEVGSAIQVLAPATSMPLAAWRLAQRRFLPAGSYEVRAGTRYHRPASARVAVVAGKCTQLALPLELELESRTIHGTYRTERGAELPNLDLFVRVEGAGAAGWNVVHAPDATCGFGRDAWIAVEETAAGPLGRFTLEHVPAGRIEAYAQVSGLGVRTSFVERKGGIVELELLVLDDPDAPGYGFEVLTHDGAQEAFFRVDTRALDGGPALHRDGVFGRAIARGSAAERRLEWAVSALGSRPVFGTQRDFVDRGDGLALARVTLQPGWGTRVVARDPEGRPLAGVEVELDGAPAGVTDASGELDLARAAPPTRLAFRYGSWQLVEGSSVPEHYSSMRGPWHELTFAPPR